MRYEVWELGDKYITIKKEKRMSIVFGDGDSDKNDAFLTYPAYMEEKEVFIRVEEYERVCEADSPRQVTWFELPDDEEEEYEDE